MGDLQNIDRACISTAITILPFIFYIALFCIITSIKILCNISYLLQGSLFQYNFYSYFEKNEELVKIDKTQS